MPNIIGTAPNQVPTNADLGTMAFQEASNFLSTTNPSYSGTMTGGTGVVNLGSGQFYKDSSGNVGIGTSSPVSSTGITQTIYGSQANLYFQNTSSGTTSSDGFSLALINSDAYINNRESGNLITYVNGTERMRIDSSGNVGIGTSSPGVPLQVLKGAAGADVAYLLNSGGYGVRVQAQTGGSGTNTMMYVASGESLALGTNNTERMRIDSSGNVLIQSGSLQEHKSAIAASNIDLSTGNYFTKTISGATTLTVSNVPATGTAASFILDLTNGGSATITWWSGVKWAGGTAPTLTASGRDVLGFFTHDGGTTWTGLVLGKDLK